jgi:hypothetical protein
LDSSAILEFNANLRESFIALGGALPPLPGVRSANTGAPCAGILLLGRVTPIELRQTLDDALDPALPVADFAANHDLRRDFVGEQLNVSTLQAFREHSARIWHRLNELPFRSDREDWVELNLLRLTYSRGVSIEGTFTADSTLIVQYPLLGREAGTRQRLEALADLDLLRRNFFTRTHACLRCGSARLHAYEACAACGSGDLREEPIVHHYRCGWQGPESRFAQGRLLVCPKCRRELRHFGVDYGKPGIVVSCSQCGAAEDQPIPHFICLDCAAVNPTAHSVSTDWYHYDLTEEGIRALRDGRLPRRGMEPVLDCYGRAFSPREFRLLVAGGIRVFAQYHRPFAVARVTITNVTELRQKMGAFAVDAAFRLAIEVAVGRLRRTDFVAPDGHDSMLIGFPETSAREATKLLAKVTKEVATAVAAPLDLMVTAVDGDAAAALLDHG